MMASISDAQITVPLYKEVPNSKPALNYNEKADTGTDGIIRISKVSIPDITIFPADNSSANNTAVIICPGGGYAILAYNLEGTEVAKIFNSWGVTAVVLKYRLPNDLIMKDKSIAPLQDAQRALQYVRENAKQLKIDPQKVGIMGFSAATLLLTLQLILKNLTYRIPKTFLCVLIFLFLHIRLSALLIHLLTWEAVKI